MKKDPFRISQFARLGAENEEGALRDCVEAPPVKHWVPQQATLLLLVQMLCSHLNNEFISKLGPKPFSCGVKYIA